MASTETRYNVLLRNGLFVGARSMKDGEYTEVHLGEAVDFDESHARHLAKVLEGRLVRIARSS